MYKKADAKSVGLFFVCGSRENLLHVPHFLKIYGIIGNVINVNISEATPASGFLVALRSAFRGAFACISVDFAGQGGVS